MPLELYQAETARIAAAQSALLIHARKIMSQGRALSGLEQNGVLHALQVLIENAIGKVKQLLKLCGEPVPVSVYDAFSVLAQRGEITAASLPAWNAMIGLRNRIVHDYMNIDMDKVMAMVQMEHEAFITQFLLQPIGLPSQFGGESCK